MYAVFWEMSQDLSSRIHGEISVITNCLFNALCVECDVHIQ